MSNTLIQSPISSHIELSVNQALTRLNDKYHMIGEPDVVAFYEGEKVNAMFTIGTKNGKGRDSYRVISVRECDIIWGIIYNTLPTLTQEKRYYLFRDTNNNWFLVNSKTKTSVPDKTYTDISTGKVYVAKDGQVRDICDFFTKTEVDELIGETTDGIVQADWTDPSPLSRAFIRNKPTTFSGFEEDIFYSISPLETPTPGFYNSYTLTKNGEALGDTINIPKDYSLKSGTLETVIQEDKQPGGKFYDYTLWLVGDPYLDLITGTKDSTQEDQHVYILVKGLIDVYTAGQGINITGKTISVTLTPGNGLDLYNEGIMVSDVTNFYPGAMPAADHIKLEGIDPEDITKKEDLFSGAVEVGISETTKNIVSPSKETEVIGSEGFSFRSTAGDYSVGPGEAIVQKIAGQTTPFTPVSLQTHSNNAIVPVYKKANSQINPNKTISSSSIINYSLYWFPCIKGVLSESTFDLQNNGYAITSYDTPLGLVGFSTSEPNQYISEVDQILNPTITPYSNSLIHYLPPDNGWIIVTVNNDVQDKLCARLSWSGAYDKTYETPESFTLELPGTAVGKTVGEDTVEDYWYDDDGVLGFHQAYGEINMTTNMWGELQTSTGGHDATLFIVRYRGEGTNSIQVLSPSLTTLPEKMIVDGTEQTVTRTYTFGDDLVHEVKFKFGAGIELPTKAFYNVTNITSAIIPTATKILGVDCFRGSTDLRIITLSPNLESIGVACFLGCTNLTTVRIFDPTPATIYYNTFPESCNFYIPEDYMTAYQSNNMWSGFGDRLKQGRSTRYYYKYDGLRGVVKEYTQFTIGLPGISVTDLGTIEADGTEAPEGKLYYELRTKTNTTLSQYPSHFNAWDYGTEAFTSGQTSGRTEIIYPVSLYDDLRHSRTELEEKLEEQDIDTEINDSSINPVQNRVIKEYIDNAIIEVTDICKDLSRIDSFGNQTNTRNTANCYVISKPGKYKIPLVYGNGIKNGNDNKDAYKKLDFFYNADFFNALGRPITDPWIEKDTGATIDSGEVIWESDNMILTDGVEIINGYMVFNVTNIPETGGNAVIGAKSGNDILWSWHLWITKENISPVSIWNRISTSETMGTEYKLMPVNLGWTWDDNTKVRGKGLYYQWGRKDPIPGPSAYNSTTNPTLAYGSFTYNGGSSGTVPLSIKSPNKFYLNRGDYNNWCDLNYYYNYWNAESRDAGFAWGDSATVKTVYDPCPPGWKIPPGGIFRGFTTSGSSSSSINRIGSFDYGWTFKKYYGDTTGTFFPASGNRSRASGGLNTVGTGGYYWSSATYSQSYAYLLYFNSTNVGPLYNNNRAYGFPVRPIFE